MPSSTASRAPVSHMGAGRGPGHMQINTRRGGRGVYFRDPNGHVLELLTRP